MIIVLTEHGKQVDAFFKTDGTDDQLELDVQSPMAKLLKATVDNKEEN
jgi:hypothetical protein